MTFSRSIEGVHRMKARVLRKVLTFIPMYFTFSLLSSDLCRNDNVYGMLRPKIRAEALCFIDLEK